LDTNGTDPVMLKKLLDEKLIDYVAMDLKNELNMMDYKKIIQVEVDIKLIKESIKLLINSNIDYEFRTTVAPGISRENIINIAKEIKGANKYYLQEFQDMEVIDNECKLKGWLKEDDLKLILEEIRSFVKECNVR
jgi:pyruvate formate lyase activating enzyme